MGMAYRECGESWVFPMGHSGISTMPVPFPSLAMAPTGMTRGADGRIAMNTLRNNVHWSQQKNGERGFRATIALLLCCRFCRCCRKITTNFTTAEALLLI
ncbi:hypothetical protein I7I53_05464 [Histoplasma capsulatum var. duboisii H88]|uniref:Uncharacterized protein n=1 Tax=Ajellomyces capsulatus (strain H88) TaxID=544711 RepID=A0A8A1LUX7_AJEC8|nr:hypothetical protein I7I53_05464 [Histoplasma capsulatum var. duboisii H88]